jgi:hypothetical protein
MTGPPSADQPDRARRVRPYLAATADESPPTTTTPPPVGPRPFVLTAGRVAASGPFIGLESQVVARPVGPTGHLARELRAILATCWEPVSVAEISARLGLHLGVTQVLVGDLLSAGFVAVETADLDQAPDPTTILRVIDALRAIA